MEVGSTSAMHALKELATPSILGRASKVEHCNDASAPLCQWHRECGGMTEAILQHRSGAFGSPA